MTGLSLRGIAYALGGEVVGHQVLCPGPGHGAKDRSLSIRFSATAPGGFLVHSHAGDDWQACRDYVCERLGLPIADRRRAAPPRAHRAADDVKAKGAVIHRFGRMLKELALSDSRDAQRKAIAFIRPRKSAFRQTSSKQQRRGRDVVFAQCRNGFSCGEPRRRWQPLPTRFFPHDRRSRREAWQDLLAFWQMEASRPVA
jgi:hypothetical protein